MQNPHEATTDQTSQISLLSALGQSFAGTLEMSALLNQIISAALTLTHSSQGLVILTDTTQPGLLIDLSTSSPQPIGREHPLAASLLSGAGDTRQPTLATKLIHSSRAIGVLGVTRRPGDEPYAAHSAELLDGLSGYASIAIESARQYEEALARTRELQLLVESSNAVSSSLDLGSVLNNISRHTMRALDTDWCIISSRVPGSAEFRQLAEYRKAIWPAQHGQPLDLEGHPFHRDILYAGQPQMAHINAASSRSAERSYLAQRQAQRMLIVPFQARGQIVGIAELSNLHIAEPFSAAQIGHSLRIALELAPLIGSSLGGTRYRALGDMVRSLLYGSGADWCNVYAWDPTETALRREAAFGSGIWTEHAAPALGISESPFMSVVTVEQRIGVLRSSDSALTGEERAYFAALGQGAMLVMPLAFKGNTVGLVQLFDLDPQRDFMPRDLALAHTLATQAAIALENARLVQDLQRSLAELRAMQSHLVHAARLSALGELSAVVAHQINNPLTTILGDAEMLVQDIPTDDPKHASAEAIRRAGQRAKSVVARILTMSRMEYEPVRLDVNRTIEETLALVMPQIVQLPIVMDVSLSPGLPAVEAIPGQLEDVWMNLVMNGRDAIVDGGVEDGRIGVSSTLAPDRKQIVVTISDNGRGIPEEHLSRVFEPLFTTKPRGQGTGLGLYIVRQILTEHGGDIIIDSSPGRGTRVTVILPVASHSDEEGRWRIS